MVKAKWDAMDQYEKAGLVMNYVAAILLLVVAGAIKIRPGMFEDKSCTKKMFFIAFPAIMVLIGNTAFIVH